MLTKTTKGLVTANRKKIRGRDAKVYVALCATNVRTRPADQTLYSAGFKSLVTVGGTFTAGSYVLPVGSDSYTYVAASGDSNTTVRDGLMALVNAANVAYHAVLANSSGGDRTFLLVSDTTFTPGSPTAVAPATLDAAAVSGAATAAKGAVAITLLAATTTEMQAGQFVLFEDRNSFQFVAQLSAKAVVGATSLAVYALPEKIPAGSSCEFPVYLWDRTDASIDRSYELAAATDFNSGSDRDGVIVGGEKNISLPGNFAYYNAGGQTLRYAAERGTEFIVERRFDPPNDNYSSGYVTWGAAVVTSAPDTASNDSFVTQDFECSFLGPVTEIEPVAI